MTKQELRHLYKQKRNSLTDKQLALYNDLMLLQFQQMELPYVSQVASYYPLESYNEPDTFLLTRYLSFQNPQIQIAYPKVLDNGSMHMVIATPDSEYAENEHGINELTEGEIMQPNTIELIIVPTLCCNYKGHRVGYGKGFYDKYLTQCNHTVITIGLCYFDPVATITDLQQFDVPLTYCLTPDVVYEC